MPKDLCSLSKQRKNQFICSRINFYKNYIKCDNTHQSTSFTCTKENLNNEESTSIFSEYISLNSPPKIKENCGENSLLDVEQQSVSSNSSFPENESHFSYDENSTIHNLSNKLQWMIEEQISHKAGNALLKILRDFDHNSLPKDIRTLMQREK